MPAHSLSPDAIRPSPPVDKPATEAKIRQLDADWVKAAVTHCADAFYADDAVVLPPNEGTLNTKESIRKSMASFLSMPALVVNWTDDKVVIADAGDMAYVYGTYKISAKSEWDRRICRQL